MGNVLVDVVLPLALAFIMFTLGLGLRIADFLRVFSFPKAFLTGFANQMILLPIVGWIIALLLGMPPELAVGLIILSLSPGGVTTNVLTKLGKGNVALSVSLTAVVTVVSVVTLPLVLGVAVRSFLGADTPEVDTVALSVTMFLMTVVPVALGMGVTALFPGFVVAAGVGLSRIAVALFALIVLAAIATNLTTIRENIATLGPASLLLMAVMMGLGLLSARLLNLGSADATTIAIETGVQNSTLSIAVAAILAGQILGPTQGFSTFALPGAMYGVLMYLLAVPFVLWRRRHH